ncbi:MAG TPA: hypothetical protein VNW92_20065 [Polyangiaceae bacterium]|nr:hypothetical protein [Polyangiaceae bacterium]
MGRTRHLEQRVWIVALGFGLAACGLDSSVAVPSAPALPANGGATLTGAGASGTGNDAAVTEFGDTPVIATVDGGDDGDASAGGDPGGIDSGGAPSWSVGGIGGAASNRGGAAGAGGFTEHNGGSAGKTGVAGSSASAGAGGASAPPTALFFSEYVEGSSSNKALEIAATQRSVLDTCKVGAYFNGSGEASVVASLSGVLEAGHVLTLCTSTLKDQLGAVCNQVGRLTFNGNDAVALACDGKILDVIGQIGVDPGTAWGSGSTTTIDHSLRRKCSVTTGDPSGLNAFDPSSEWQSFPIDTFSGLGSRGC